MWGSLNIFLADKKFTKKEQNIFKKIFGEKSTISILSLIKISSHETIEKRIQNAFNDASTLIVNDKKKLLSELEKLLSVSDGDKSLTLKSFEKIKKLISF